MYVYNRRINNATIHNLLQDLREKNIDALMKQDMNSDPNINYNFLENEIISSMNKYMPLKKSKFHKHKEKKTKWITKGILKSIKFRDNLYTQMRKLTPDTDVYYEKKHNLMVYNRILKRSIRMAKINYYSNKFNTYRSDSKKTWKTINNVLKKSDSKNFLIIYILVT
jgi:hypothetical protein